MTAHLQQGASGAGQFTGKPQPVTILYTNWRGETAVRRILINAIAYGNEALGLAYGRNEWHLEEQWLLSATDADKGERRTFAMSGIKAWGQAAVDAALASRADGAGVTAGVLWSAWSEDDCDSDPRIDPMAQKCTEWFVGRWPVGADEPECRILVGEGRSAEIVARRIAEKLTSVLNTDAILAQKASPAPAAGQSGAVPDSLRALSEVVYLLRIARCGLAAYGAGAFEDTIARIDALLAAHPAGQSTGPGTARTPEQQEKIALAQCLERGPAPDSTRTGDEGTDLAFAQAQLRNLLKSPRICHCELSGEFNDITDGCCELCEKGAALAASPAAPEGYRLISAEMTPAVMERMASNLSDEFGPDFVAEHKAFALSVYAEAYASGVRPAAPEAQGAWRERVATEIDAIGQQWRLEGDANGQAYAKTLAAIIRAEAFAPPASSGQGGR